MARKFLALLVVFLVGTCFRGFRDIHRYTWNRMERRNAGKLRGTGKAYPFRGRFVGEIVLNRLEKWRLQKWQRCRGRGGEGGADRSACKRFPAPLRGVRGVRTYRCTDRGALRGAIPFSCHVQPMMRLLHSYLAPRYRRLPSHGAESEEELSLSLSFSAISRCTCTCIVHTSFSRSFSPSISIAFSSARCLRNEGITRNPMDKNAVFLPFLFFFFLSSPLSLVRFSIDLENKLSRV